ncbi:recombinase family protein [Alicyclobacillus ferrooxydans]|uniref:Resolvase/invertase-type recombinase catalytic domain-containing protein n=1 Tax=Alicyclobacillus ferrooxydans TaxID=471514 RepID=A0A0P9D2U5_9BACL|nr:recombinase family protein [Alicyclobacillus ferrooxydans]KPV43833.1 hypothetical protein AN477_10700 [Alicyclobacillus ferrooxydans]
MSNSTQTNPTLNKNLQPQNEAFIYVRSAHANQLQLQSQVRSLQEQATTLDFICEQAFEDRCSGMTEPTMRPGFLNLIKAIQDTPTVSAILVSDHARISRSLADLSVIENLLKDFGVDIIYAEE